MTRIGHERANYRSRVAASNHDSSTADRELARAGREYGRGEREPRAKPEQVGSGILFRNDRKEPDSKQPDYRGELTIGNAKHRIAGWIKTDKNGHKFLALALSEA